MSTYFVLSRKVSARDLFDGRLAKWGIREHVFPQTEENSRCLTDGRNYLWVAISSHGWVGQLSRYGASVPSKILHAIVEAFHTEIFSEHEPQYWGYSTREEWAAAWSEMDERSRREFYDDVWKFVRGGASNLISGTIGETKGMIAKALVEKNAALLEPENKDKLMAEMEAVYDRDHTVVIRLTQEELALAQMLGTYEDDLPQA
jgi:hypothetical protein